MNYPQCEPINTSGATLIAITAFLHVFIAHLAVDGGLFLVVTEIKAHRTRQLS